MGPNRILSKLVFVGLLASAFGLVPSSAAVGCATTPSTNGDWPTHGGDMLGTRSQAFEDDISTSNVGTLEAKWTASLAGAGAGGTIQTIPIEAEGCLYLQTSNGGNWLIALNADTGELVWKRLLLASGCHAAPHVVDGVVYINEPTNTDPDELGPHLLALDAATGAELFVGDEVATEDNTGANAGCAAPAIYFDGVVLIGITNAENAPSAIGGFAVVDAATGKLIKRTYVIPADEAASGFPGCSIWSAYSIDPVTKHAYTGTAQPGGSIWLGKESELCNAIIKIDLDRSSPTFGDIVGAMKGTPDDPPYPDVDFGAGPTVLRDADGRQVVAMLQKSGYVHAGYTRHMTHAWTLPVGGFFFEYTASASDGANVFTVGGAPGQLFSINGTSGLPNWVTPVVSPFATNSVAYANGVVYYGDEKAVLNAYDASNGVPLLARPIVLDTLDVTGCTRNQSGGVSIARGQVYMACGGVVAAYGLP